MDSAESAKTAHRPQLQALLARLDTDRDVDYVIVHKVDRLARSRADDVAIVAAIRAAGAQLVSVTENIDETPTGSLLHGIMASVAEFYSRNLATEILKGTVQKAQSGGTPTRTPLGYLNVQRFDHSREIRTVEVDPERAPLIQWAFAAYASGSYSLASLCDELNERGLRTKPTRANPGGRPLSTSVLGRILNDRYYIGVVSYRGIEYAGKHPKLIAPDLFARVAMMLESRTNGQKDRKHWHYLKGLVHCGLCGRRLIFTKARGRGGIYEYYVCAGRHNDKSGCALPHLRASDVETRVAGYYRQNVRLPVERLADVRRDLEVALRGVLKAKLQFEDRAHRTIARLEADRRKLLGLHYADQIPADLFAEEQRRITTELAAARAELGPAAANEERLVAVLDELVEAARNSDTIYAIADAHTRRQLNVAFFKALFVNQHEVSGAELTEPYAACCEKS